jgi:hypothetical protein
VFNIRYSENIEKAKYSTKNNIREPVPIFLAIKNQDKARISSSSILRLRATRICIVWPSVSFFCPLWKIKIVINDMVKKQDASTKTSLNIRLISVRKVNTRPAISTSEVSKSNPIRYLLKVTWESDHLIKSLRAV